MNLVREPSDKNGLPMTIVRRPGDEDYRDGSASGDDASFAAGALFSDDSFFPAGELFS